MDLNLRSGYAGQYILELLQLAKKDAEMLKMVEANRLNRISTVNALDNIKTLTADTLYRSR